MSSAHFPLLPLDIRLRTLESQLFGVPPSIIDLQQYPKGKGESSNSKSAIRQIQEAEEVFERLCSESEGIKRLLEGYEQYLPLLNPPSSSTPAGENEGDEQTISESDLLPDKVKLTMVLESYNDIKGAERDLREIDQLRERDVQGSGALEDLLPLKPILVDSIKQTQRANNEISNIKRDLNGVLNRYNEFTSTTSDLFIDLHHQLQYLEDRIYKLERKKKKEIEGRY